MSCHLYFYPQITRIMVYSIGFFLIILYGGKSQKRSNKVNDTGIKYLMYDIRI